MFELLRLNRVVTGEFNEQSRGEKLTAFLGLFNAMSYLAELEKQLEAQVATLPIVVVDNQSEDGTWSAIQPWLTKFRGRILLVRNAINLGGTGTLLANMDLIPSEWVATLHQDDFYKPNHLSTLKRHVESAQASDIGFSTDMGSMSAAGRRTPVPPRASWLLPDGEQATMFLSNLRLHNFPFPASAFRVSALVNSRAPWHSTTFPDTELVLSWVLEGNLNFIAAETMLYRENPNSESHTVNARERDLGTYLALTRVFGLTSFGVLIDNLPERERAKFFISLTEGIRLRVRDEKLTNLLCLQVAELCAYRWDYSEALPDTFIIGAAKSLGANRTASLISDLANFYSLELEEISESHQDATNSHSDLLMKRAPIKFVLTLYGFLPYKLRKFLAKSVARKLFQLRKNTGPWDMNWRS